MKPSVFIAFCWFLAALFVQSFLYFQNRLNGSEHLKAQVRILEVQLAENEIQTELVRYQLADFQQQVASLLPSALSSPSGESPQRLNELRGLASVVQKSEPIRFERASTIFERAKNEFRLQKYDSASEGFEKLIRERPESIHVPEAFFLLVESQFQSKNFQAAVANIERMAVMFPENELTGLSLLRLAKIFQIQDRPEDAAAVLNAVIATYANPKIKDQAQLNLRELR